MSDAETPSKPGWPVRYGVLIRGIFKSRSIYDFALTVLPIPANISLHHRGDAFDLIATLKSPTDSRPEPQAELLPGSRRALKNWTGTTDGATGGRVVEATLAESIRFHRVD